MRLYRDRPGIKPLYYYYDGRRFAFASELKALEKALPVRASSRSTPPRCYDFLGYRYVPAPKTLYQAVLQAAAGARARVFAGDGHAAGAAPLLEHPVPERRAARRSTTAARSCAR